jgi:outer membrane protein OmpA-like peptidoglycan-associated protein
VYSKSDWTFDTSYGLGGTAGKIGIERQSIRLKDPSGNPVLYNYKAVTFGWSSDDAPTTKGGSTSGAYSVGDVYKINIGGRELTRTDFVGFATLAEGSLALKGGSQTVTLMWLGVPKSRLATEAASSPAGIGVTGLFFPGVGYIFGHLGDYVLSRTMIPGSIFEQHAKAFVIFRGYGLSSMTGGSIGGGMAYVNLGDGQDPDVPYVTTGELDMNPPLSPEPTETEIWDRRTAKISYPLPSDFLFAFDRSDLDVSLRAAEALWNIAQQIRAKNPDRIGLEGYTDSVGQPQHNMKLSRERAETIRQLFIAFGLRRPNKIKARGFGASNPVGNNATEEGRQRNRRVEVVLY